MPMFAGSGNVLKHAVSCEVLLIEIGDVNSSFLIATG